jgi:hypothetical protein
MTILDNIQNKISYGIYQLTYDPAADQLAKEREAARIAEEKRLADALAKASAEEAVRIKQQQDAAAKAEADRKNKERAEFRPTRMIGSILNTVMSIVGIFLLFGAAVLGASLATNLNVYRSWPYRILYAVYGFIFFMVVIPYVYLYRWFWKGKRPTFYALLPLMPYRLEHPITANFFSWLTFRPDQEVHALEEWKAGI